MASVVQVLEFYSVHRRVPFAPRVLLVDRSSCSRVRSLAAALAALVSRGCATTGAGPAPPKRLPRRPHRRPPLAPRNVEPPPPNVNLSGFPLPYRQGYADGCAQRGRHRAQGHDALRGGWQLSHRMAGRPRALPEEMTRRDRRACACGAPSEGGDVAPRRAARPRAPRADVGRSRGAEALSAARLDGRRARRSSFWSMRFARDLHAIAPDLRGFGRSEWQPQGYWFADYIADLEALIDVLAPGERVDLVGHSLGGNVVMLYAGVRPARVRRVVSLEGFGIPAEAPDRAPAKIAAWLDALAEPPEFAPYRESSTRSPTGCRRTIRACRATRRCSSPRTGQRRAPTAARVSPPIRGTSCRSRRLPRRGGVRGLAQHHGADAVGRRRRIVHPDLARRPSGRRGAAPTGSTASGGASRTSAMRGSSSSPTRRTCCITISRRRSRPRSRRSSRTAAADDRAAAGHPDRRGAYVALVALTLIWGMNWVVMKQALARRSRSCSTSSAHGSRSSCCSPRCSSRRAAAARGSWRRRSSRASSRRRSTSSRRRWRSPGAAPAGPRCSCSRCRSGRC